MIFCKELIVLKDMIGLDRLFMYVCELNDVSVAIFHDHPKLLLGEI